MSFTNNTDELATSELYQVRLLIRDTVEDRAKFQDEEINWYITQEANIYMAGAALAESLVLQGGAIKRKKVDGLDITYDVGLYRTLSTNLRARGVGHQTPYAGGISVSDKQGQERDTDATKPSMFRQLNDNPNAPRVGRPGTPDDPLTTI